MSSAVPAAVRAVRDALTANLPDGTVIIVGPGATNTGAMSYVFVGVNDPNAEGEEDAVSGSQSWAQLGGKQRNEEFAIHCCAVAWNGDDDQLAAMDGAFALLAAIETALVNDPSLAGSLLYAPGITAMGLKFLNGSSGAAAYLPFDVSCRSRI